MSAGDAIYQAVGYLFEAKDLATPAVNAAQRAFDVASKQTYIALGVMTGHMEKSTAKIGAAFKFVGNSFTNVFGDLYHSTMNEFGLGMEKLANTIRAPFDKAYEGIKKFGTSITDHAKAAWKFATQQQLSFSMLYKAIGDGVPKALAALKGLASNGIERITRNLSSAIVQVGQFVRSLGALDKIKAGISGLAGIFSGGLSGGLGLVMKLLTPLLNMFERALTPAIETFSDLMENAFAPLSFVAETVARNLAPLLAKFLTPLVGMLTVVVARAGTFLAKLLDTSKAAGPLTSIFAKLQGTVSKVFEALVGLAGKILPVVFKLVERLMPIVGKVVDAVGTSRRRSFPRSAA
jgi:phage-related protein